MEGIKNGLPLSEAESMDAPCRSRSVASCTSASSSANLSAHQLYFLSLAESVVFCGIGSAFDGLVYDVSELVEIYLRVSEPDAVCVLEIDFVIVSFLLL